MTLAASILPTFAEEEELLGSLEMRLQDLYVRSWAADANISQQEVLQQAIAIIEASDPDTDRKEDNRRGLYGFVGVYFGPTLVLPGASCTTGFRPPSAITQYLNLSGHLDTEEKELHGAAARLYAEAYNEAALEAKAYTVFVHQICKPAAPEKVMPAIIDAGSRPTTANGPVRLEWVKTPRPLGATN